MNPKSIASILIAALAPFALPSSVLASNFDHCYSKTKGLDQACLARKNYETDYYTARSNELHFAPRRQFVPAAPPRYDENGRFVPTPIPQRQPYVLPGLR